MNLSVVFKRTIANDRCSTGYFDKSVKSLSRICKYLYRSWDTFRVEFLKVFRLRLLRKPSCSKCVEP